MTKLSDCCGFGLIDGICPVHGEPVPKPKHLEQGGEVTKFYEKHSFESFENFGRTHWTLKGSHIPGLCFGCHMSPDPTELVGHTKLVNEYMKITGQPAPSDPVEEKCPECGLSWNHGAVPCDYPYHFYSGSVDHKDEKCDKCNNTLQRHDICTRCGWCNTHFGYYYPPVTDKDRGSVETKTPASSSTKRGEVISDNYTIAPSEEWGELKRLIHENKDEDGRISDLTGLYQDLVDFLSTSNEKARREGKMAVIDRLRGLLLVDNWQPSNSGYLSSRDKEDLLIKLTREENYE